MRGCLPGSWVLRSCHRRRFVSDVFFVAAANRLKLVYIYLFVPHYGIFLQNLNYFGRLRAADPSRPMHGRSRAARRTRRDRVVTARACLIRRPCPLLAGGAVVRAPAAAPALACNLPNSQYAIAKYRL